MFDVEFYRLPNGKAPVEEFLYVGNKIILTNGFIKKTQKTPTAEIELARKYKEDYEACSKEANK